MALWVYGRREQRALACAVFWERARALRSQGDWEGALAALENVFMLEPDHVGALALSGDPAAARAPVAARPRLALVGKAQHAGDAEVSRSDVSDP